MKIENVKISELVPAGYNPRKLSDSQYQQISRSLEEFGMVDPIVVNNSKDRKNVIIGGHQRVKVWRELGHDTIPVVYVNLPPLKERELNIRLNKAIGDWNWDILRDEFEKADLIEWGFEDIDFEVEIDPETQDDDVVPEAGEKVITQPGDLYELGNHRLLCGDSTVATDVEKAMGGHLPILMVTDPPYGVEYDPKWRKDLHPERSFSLGKVQNDDRVDWKDAYALFSGDVCYVWHAGKSTQIVSQNIQDCGFVIISQIIWAKNALVMSRGDYHWQHEPCLYAVRKGKKHNWQGARDQTTLWKIANNSNAGSPEDKEKTWGHGTQKPLPCMQRPILNNSKKGEFVYDPFAGTGTTLIACEKNKRHCLTVEIDQGYCDIIVQRYIEFCKANGISPKVTKNGEECTEFD